MNWSEIACWIVTGTLIIGGLVSTPLPIVPGPLLILGGGVLFKIWNREGGADWWGLGLMLALAVIAYVFEFISSAAGARYFGSSRWGIAGALIGGIIGMFFFPIGLVAGPIIGVFAFEMLFAKKKARHAGKSTVGTVVGTVAGMVAKVVLAIGMTIVFGLDVFVWK